MVLSSSANSFLVFKQLGIKMNKLLKTIKSIIWLLLLTLSFCFLVVNPAFAHSPHDDIYQVEISPKYARDSTLYVIVRGNLLKSLNGGSSWQRIVNGIDNKYKLWSLSISPQNKNILFLSSLGDGVYKSEDEGNSWVKVNNGLKELKIDRLLISPYSTDVVCATGIEQGLYITKNGGKSWKQVIDNNIKITAIAFSPNNKDRIIAGDNRGNLYYWQNGDEVDRQVIQVTKNTIITDIVFSPNFSLDKTFFVSTENKGIYKTINDGQSFLAINRGLSDLSIKDLVISANDGQKTFTLFASAWHEGIFYSDNAGNSWQKKWQKGLTKDTQADEDRYNRPHFSDLRLSNDFSQDRTMFLAGFNGLFKSTNSGRTWKELDTLSPRIVTTLAISPNYKNDSTIAIGTYRRTAYLSEDKGVTWKHIDRGLSKVRYKNSIVVEQPRFYSIVFSPNYALDKTIFASLRYQFVKSTDRGKNWKNIPLKNVNGHSLREIIVVPSPNFANDKTIYLATYSGNIYRSKDGGENFSIISDFGRRISFLAISPNFSVDNTLYASSYQGVYQTVDGGISWQSITNNITLQDRIWLELAISPNYQIDKTIIAVTDHGLYLTKDKGNNWEKVSVFTEKTNSLIQAIAISPNYQNDRTFIVTVKGKGMYKTVDGGKTFIQIGKKFTNNNYSLSKMDNIPSTSTPIQFSPNYSIDNTIYAYGSASSELFRSIDNGNTWQIISIPTEENKIDNFMTFLRIGNLALTVYPILNFFVALIMAIPAYILVGHLGLEKKLPLSKSQIKTGALFLVFTLVFVFLYWL